MIETCECGAQPGANPDANAFFGALDCLLDPFAALFEIQQIITAVLDALFYIAELQAQGWNVGIPQGILAELGERFGACGRLF